MANRRCIDVRKICSASFIDLGKAAQALYLHIIANADDDGICEAKLVLRIAGIRKTALDDLIRAGFITMIIPDKYVVYINGWQAFNTIDARYGQPSNNRETLKAFFPDIKLVDFKRKTSDMHVSNSRESESNQREDKSNKGKVSQSNTTDRPPTLKEVTDYCKQEKMVVDPEAFFFYFEAAGWLDEKQRPIKNWKRMLYTWNRTEKEAIKSYDNHKDQRQGWDDLTEEIFGTGFESIIPENEDEKKEYLLRQLDEIKAENNKQETMFDGKITVADFEKLSKEEQDEMYKENGWT